MPTVERECCAYIIRGRGYGREGQLVQTDWDYPSTARDLGWNMRRVQVIGRSGAVRIYQRAPIAGCDHRGTDGTVDCPDCGITASQFIQAAGEYLDSKC